jgi:predicted secreted protein
MSNYTGGKQYLDKVLSINLTQKGNALADLGNYTGGKQYLDKVLSINPNDELALAGKRIAIEDKLAIHSIPICCGPHNESATTFPSSGTVSLDYINSYIILKKGQLFNVTISGNGSIGDDWNATFNKNILQLISQKFKSYSTNIGAGGTFMFTFKTIQSGNTTIIKFYNDFRGEFVKDEKIIIAEIL